MQKRFLVTAGSTRERIDEVRDWGNIFTGNTGFAIARALAPLGHVDLLTSNREHLRALGDDTEMASRISGAGFATHADLKSLLGSLLAGGRYHAAFMTAAVSDYRPAGAFEIVSRETGAVAGEERWVVRDAQAAKIRSHHGQIAVLGERTEKLVDLFRTEWEYRGLLVKFKLEVGIDVAQLIAIGRASRMASGADFLVANTLEMVNGANAGAYLISAGGEEFIARGDLPGRLALLAGQAPDREPLA